ncbi:HAD family hydrolase [Spirochaeta isovalerica]|uniref:HAD superfamily hydrolase (TIGR01509 family) n=1 Tax=Spirochaeta isovalerica TaxID=150 RepID=A0A841R5T2_9SPIO|nr:HAD family hydrolase [Spirochaeta isovalerica]MBB6478507.1 HAD superfamily hydrolase (TIGR01509 family) [Spirochaeta isovalerica]
MGLKAVIFDFDGTLTKAGAINFSKIRKLTGCPADRYLLDYLEMLPEEKKRKAEEILDCHEYSAACQSREEDYAHELISFLNRLKIPVFILSWNSRKAIIRALENFRLTKAEHFLEIISRDDPFPVKPDPQAILHIAEKLNIDCSEILIVGDYIHDIEAGRNAGCKTAYKKTGRENDHRIQSDFLINKLDELLPVIFDLTKNR